MKTKKQAEDEAAALQTEKEKIYRNITTGKLVKVKMINAQEFLENYDVQISAEELDTALPHPTRVTEKADTFFEKYQIN